MSISYKHRTIINKSLITYQGRILSDLHDAEKSRDLYSKLIAAGTGKGSVAPYIELKSIAIGQIIRLETELQDVSDALKSFLKECGKE